MKRQIFFSPGTRGFFDSRIHGKAIPADAVPVSPARHRELLDALNAGAEVRTGAGAAVSIHRPRHGAHEKAAAAIAAVKREASRRILAIAPIWRQLNDNAAIAAAALQLNATMTTGVDVAPALARRAAIDAVRAASDRLESAIAAMSAAELAAVDVANEGHWQ